MKSLKLKKLVAAALTLTAVTAISPVAASAAWKQDAKGWWNTEGNSWSIGWRQIDGVWYHFDSTGYMSTGWINDNGTWYYADQSGAMKTGWVIDYSAGYGQWYYLAPSGAMQTGWVNDNGTWYFLKQSGAMATGWVNDNGTWYFTSVSGAMQTGVVEVGGKVYYLQPSGAMATGEVEINGVKYTFAASGEAVGDNIPTPDKVFTANGTPANESSNSGSNSGSSSSDSDSSSSSSSSSGSSGGGSGSSTPAAIRAYNTSANIIVEKVSDEEADVDTYEVRFKNELELNKDTDYVVRDLYVTNNDAEISEEKDEDGKYYVVTVKKDSKLDIKGVTRIVREGKVYYVTGSTVK